MTTTHSYKVTLRVKNEAGVLARITVLIRKFQINIRSLDVAPIDLEERFSDIHLTLETTKSHADIAMKKLSRLIPVIDVKYDELKSA